MKTLNRQASALPSTITPHDLGRAMAQLDLSAVPPHKRHLALIEHLARIMSDTVTDPKARAHLQDTRLLAAQLRAGRP